MITGSDRRCRVEYVFLFMLVTSSCCCIAYLLQWKMKCSMSSGVFVQWLQYGLSLRFIQWRCLLSGMWPVRGCVSMLV